MGRLISKYSRDSDCAARLGGEEFMVIAPQTDLNSAYILANKLKTKVESYIHHCGQHQIKVTISSGVSILVAAGSVEQTYKQADDALYLAKNSVETMFRFILLRAIQIALLAQLMRGFRLGNE